MASRTTLLRRLALSTVCALLAAACGSPGPTPPAPSAIPPAAAAGATPAAPGSAAPSGPSATSPAGTASSPGSTGSPGSASDRPDLTAVRLAVEAVAGGFDQPVFAAPAPDGSGRIYVAEQPGRIRVVDNGQVGPTPFLDITDRVTFGGERGLLGFAFAPGFGPARPVVYVHYSGADGATVVSAFRLSAHDTSVLDPASEQVVLTEPQPYPNHNGGWIGFDRDGMLLIALGDGGSAGDPENRASNPATILGKMLRIDVLDAPAGTPYVIPADNPYASGAAGARPEILHIGLRNSFRDSVDPLTGDLWIGDVGQDSWEEVDVARAGARGLDFGWRRWEGRHCYNPPSGCDPSGVTMPVAEYDHGAGCSVIGGVVYRGSAIPALHGAYLFSDYCSGTLWGIDSTSDATQAPVVLGATGASVSSIIAGPGGEVYLTDLASGRLLRLVTAG